MNITPNSWGTELREFNPCHSTADGKFTVAGQGRCLGMAARVAARAENDKAFGAEGYSGRDRHLLDPRIWGHEPDRIDKLDRTKLPEMVIRRGIAKRYAAATPLPSYLRADAQAARRADGTITNFYDGSSMVSSANYQDRTVKLHSDTPGLARNKPSVLSTLRHEIGHIDRTPLGVGGLRIGGMRVSADFAEEVRAWKNAIRNSGGKVSMTQVGTALSTYMWLEDVVQRPTVRRFGVSFFKDGGRVTAMSTNDTDDPYKARDFGLKRAERLMKARVMPVLRRYRDKVRRAARVK